MIIGDISIQLDTTVSDVCSCSLDVDLVVSEQGSERSQGQMWNVWIVINVLN